MATQRYDPSDVQWARIASLLPGKAGGPGRSGADNRLFANGCLWVLRSGAHWRDLPERCGKWKTAHRRFSRRCHAGVWERVFETPAADRDNQYPMIDIEPVNAIGSNGPARIVRAHQQAAGGKGGEASNAIGSSEMLNEIRRRGGPGVD